LDEIDMKIISILEENARTPYTIIGEKLGLSEATIRKRVEKLEKEGVILRYTLDVNPKKLGYHSITLLGLDAEPHMLLEVAETLAAMEEVKKVFTSTGGHMIMAEVWARDGKELSRLLSQKIGQIPGVKKLCPAIVLERIK